MIPDEFLINERIDMPGGGYMEVHDSRILNSFLEADRKLKEESQAFHKKMMNLGVKAYRCNDGRVDRKDKVVFFDDYDNEVGYYWGDKNLNPGDKIFIGSFRNGGRFARIVECTYEYDDGPYWIRRYKYEPLDETLDGTEYPYITEKMLTRKQRILRFFGLFNKVVHMDIWE